MKLQGVLELGLKYNIKEAIFNLALLEMVNFNYDKSLTYLDKLPHGYKSKEVNNLKQEIYIDSAIHNLRKNQNYKAIENFKKAYNLGATDLDYEIYKLYNKLGNKKNALYWLEVSSKNGKDSILKELAAMYSSLEMTDKAISTYIKIYESGDIEVAKNLYYENFKVLNTKESLKWYKISRNLGLVDINLELENLNELYK